MIGGMRLRATVFPTLDLGAQSGLAHLRWLIPEVPHWCSYGKVAGPRAERTSWQTWDETCVASLPLLAKVGRRDSPHLRQALM